jgi:acyl-coenzyme A synthetase/AMP-(fatty) acid ligase/thioesterase domain-containing protein/aryl carrier-like protein
MLEAIPPSMLDVFEQRSLTDPEGVAIRLDGRDVSVSELEARSRSLAHQFRALSGASGTVALLHHRGPHAALLTLACYRAGLTVAVLDPSAPLRYLIDVASITQPRLVICASAHSEIAQAITTTGLEVIIDDPWVENPIFDSPQNEDEHHAAKQVGPEHDRVTRLLTGALPRPDNSAPALLVFSSGTTGAPKAVVHSLATLTEIADGVIDSMGVTEFDRFADLSSFQFIAAHTTLIVCLLTGCSVTAGNVSSIGLDRLGQWLIREGVTIIRAQVALARSIAQSSDLRLTSVRLFTLAGEMAFGEDLARLREVLPRTASLQCRYGSTEAQGLLTADFACDATIPSGPVRFPRQRCVEFLDDDGNHIEDLVPGAEGQLVASERLAVGYWKRPKATSEAFVRSNGKRKFLTGDRARVCPDGSIEVLGRGDGRVKVRGHNVNLGAVEAAIMKHPDVVTAAVVDRRNVYGAIALVAFFRPAKGSLPGARVLREFLRESLPEAMIPSRFVPLDRFPSTPSGKIDRRALRASDPGADASEEADSTVTPDRVVPRDQITESLIGKISELLGLPTIGVDEDFFDHGMDSLSALELIAWIPTKFAADPRVADLVRNPTVTQLLRLIVQHHPTAKRRVVFSVAGDRGCRNALVLVPGAGDSVISMLGLARRVAGSAEVFVAQSPGVENDTGALRSVEMFAEQIVDELRRLGVLDRERIIVGGHSFGGIVAQETTRQIEIAGGVVHRLLVLDTSPPKPVADVALVRLVHCRVEAWRLDHADRQRVKALAAGNQFRDGLRVKKGIVYNQSLRSMHQHRSNRCAARILVVQADHSHHDHQNWRQEWGNLTSSEVEITHSPGTHADMHAEPHVDALASLLLETCLLD